jgi:hypothetical protein
MLAPSGPSAQGLKRGSSSSPASVASVLELPISKAALRGRFPGLSEIKISPFFGPQDRILVGNLERNFILLESHFNADESSFQPGPSHPSASI